MTYRGLLNQYWKWLKEKTTLRQINDWYEITTPYLDRHNDYLQNLRQKIRRRLSADG